MSKASAPVLTGQPRDEANNGPLPATNPRRIGWLPGPEDIVLDHEAGRAYVSSQMRRGGSRRDMNGGIYELNLNEDQPTPHCLTGRMESELGIFHPHGIDLFIDHESAAKTRFLFAINHRTAEHHSIEVFRISPDPAASLDERLTHVRSVTSDAYLTSPNDLIAVATDELYVVNDHGWRHRVYQGLETSLLAMTGIAMGSLVHVKQTDEGAQYTQLATDIAMPVGVEASPRTDPQRLFVSSAWGKEIRIYERANTKSPRAWSHARSIALAVAPDNLSWDDAEKRGDLWVAAHPDLGAMILYSAILRSKAPSRVLRISKPDAAKPHIEVIYSDDGETHSASSVAVVYRSRAALAGKERALLLIGSPWEEHVLVCDLLERIPG